MAIGSGEGSAGLVGRANGMISDGVGVGLGGGIGGGAVVLFNICAICTYSLLIGSPYSSEGICVGVLHLRILTMSVAAWRR